MRELPPIMTPPEIAWAVGIAAIEREDNEDIDLDTDDAEFARLLAEIETQANAE
jgi:hypothetical protein